MPTNPRFRIFFASAADLLTDQAANGEGLIAWNLLSALAERGHEVVACARRVACSGTPPFEVVETGRASSLESIEPIAQARTAARHFERLGGADRFDVVHWLFPQGCPPLTPVGDVSFVVGPRMEDWPQSVRTRRRRAGDMVRAALSPLEAHLDARALARADTVLVATPQLRERMSPVLAAKTRVLPFGVRVARFEAAPLPARPTVLFLGSLVRRKGIHELLDAFAHVRAALPAARLVVAGDGEERAAAEAGGAEVLGAVAHDDVPRLLAGASLLCAPSHGEPFGMNVVEAMAAGRAVVACDAGGTSYLVGERGGRLVPAHDAAALGAALSELLADRAALAEMGAHNRARAEREFDLPVLVTQLEDAYASRRARAAA